MNNYQINQLQHIHYTRKELLAMEESDLFEEETEITSAAKGSSKCMWEQIPAFSSISKDGQGTAKCFGCGKIFSEAQLTYGSKSILFTPQHYCPTCSKEQGILEFEERQD